MRKIMTVFAIKKYQKKKVQTKTLTCHYQWCSISITSHCGWYWLKTTKRIKKLPVMQRYFIMYLNITFSTETSHAAITTANNSNLLTQAAKSRVTFHNNQSLHNLASYTTPILWELPHSRMLNWLSDFINRTAEQLWLGKGFRTLTLFR